MQYHYMPGLQANIPLETCCGAASSRRRLTPFVGKAAWWMAVALVVLYVVAAGHELIPGLCTDPLRMENDCGLCHLVHTLALAAAAAILLPSLFARQWSTGFVLHKAVASPLWRGCLLRAPPTFLLP